MKYYKPLFKNSNFMKLWGSQILSQLTIQIMNFVLILLLFSQTGSTIATSMLWVTVALPAILVGPFGGAASDMFNKRKLLMATNFLQALTVFLYSLIYQSSVFLLFGAVFVYSFLNQFYIPAESASLPTIVKKKHLAPANSLFFLTQQTSIIIGFGTAGILVNYLGFEITIALCAIFLLLAFISVSFLPDMKASLKKERVEDIFDRFFKNIADGYRYIRNNNIILGPFILLLTFQIALTIILVNVPLIVEDVFGVSLSRVGPVLLFPAAIGAIIAALTTPKLLRNGWRKRRIIELSIEVLVVGFFMLVFVVPEISYPLRTFLGSLSMLFMAMSLIGVAISAQTFIQEVTPGGLRGRVFGNFWFLATILTVVPVIFSGTVSEVFGIRFLLLILGAFMAGLLYLTKKSADRIIFNGGGNV